MNSNRPEAKPFVFVLMPFRDEFDEVYLSGIKLACEAAGAFCERVIDQRFDERILDRIYNQIQSARLIVADMTGCNPNVFYEVGYAHALHKKVILVTRDVNDIPFDLRHHRHIEYKGKAYLLKDQLVEEIKWCLATPEQQLDPSSPSTVRRITRILGQVSRTVARQLEMQPLLDNIVEDVSEILDADVCSIFLNESGNPDVITCVAGCGFAREIIGRAQYTSGEGFTGKVFQRGQTTVIRSSEELEVLRQRNEFQGKYDAEQWAVYGGQSQFRNAIASPLKIGDQTVGLIKVENKRIGEFSATDVSILEAISNGVLSVAIQNARLLQGYGAQKSSRWRMVSLIKEFLDANPNPLEPGYVFALLPEKAQPIYDGQVKKAAESLGLRCESSIDFKHPGDDLREMLARMQKAEILVYDLTDLTPDVMWELGLGLAIKDAERVIVIGAESDTSSFDIDSHKLTYRYNPNSSESLDDLHKTLREVMQRINRASARKAPFQSPEVKSLLESALKAVEREEWIAAEALFQTMDLREPENWYIYNQWGITLRRKGEFETSEHKFKQALRFTDFDDEKAFIYTEIAVLHQLNQNYFEAEECFRKAERADRKNTRLYIAWAEYFNELGDYFNAQSKIAAALTRVRSEDDPRHKELTLRHAYYSKKISNPTYKKAFEQFRREEGLPRPSLPAHWEEGGNRLPYDIDWNDLVKNYVGAVVEGEISSITAEHGIFVRLSRQFTGLIFWRNLTEGFAEKFSKNEKVKVRISKAFINARDQRGRIDLRLIE